MEIIPVTLGTAGPVESLENVSGTHASGKAVAHVPGLSNAPAHGFRASFQQ